MCKYIAGVAKEGNLDKWASYARKNSYGDNIAQAKAQAGLWRASQCRGRLRAR